MSDMVPEILNAALDSLFTPKEPGEREYQGEDGLLYCRNCHTPAARCRKDHGNFSGAGVEIRETDH